MIKVIITNNDIILYNSLCEIALDYKGKIEIINIPKNKIDTLIGKMKPNNNLIILDYNTSIAFCKNILKNAMNKQVGKSNIIILVIDSRITNIKDKEHNLLKTKQSDFSVLDFVNIVYDSLRDSLEIEKNINSIFWKIGLTYSFKGTDYIKDAILFAYMDKKLLLDIQTLIKKVAQKHQISNDKVVRSDMDKALNNVLDLVNTNVIYDIFGNQYDGRKITLKYFIDLCIRYLEQQKSYILNN